ncbi:MAG: hypothetical protein RSE12_17190 [Fuscovulum sp.]|nr:MAG: hypothetical protein RSE12_17190 [Fuscovulum sp.]
MKYAALAIVAILAACATPEQLAQGAKNECDAIGYKPGTPQYVECTERGYRTMDAQQDAAAAAVTTAVLIEAFF